MARNGNLEEHHPNGHSMTYNRPLPIFPERLPYHFVRSFDFLCRQAPTQWLLKVTFHQLTPNHNIDVSVSITRTDRTPKLVDGKFWINAWPNSPIEGGLAPNIDPQSFDWPSVSPLAETNLIFEDYIPIHILRAQDGRPLRVLMSFYVHGCHVARKRNILITEKGIRDLGWKTLSSKM